MSTELEDLASKHAVAFRQGDDLLLAILRFADKAREINAEETAAFLEDLAAAYRVGMQMQPTNDGAVAAHAALGGL